MKLHIITVGAPKLTYAKQGWEEYFGRLKHYHQLRVTHIADKHNDAPHILAAAEGSFKIVLEITGHQFTSPELAELLEKKAMDGRELSFIIGASDGLPQAVIDAADLLWSFGKLTYPHDLAMVILLEALYRASTITAGRTYHK
jgi:23S rRNA (pseudouridine1915-N3)-methyltransferase